MPPILTSSIILLATTSENNRYIFGAYDNLGNATAFAKLPEDHKMFVETLRGQQTVMGVKTLLATPLDFPDGGRICITNHPEKVRNDAIPATSIEEGIAIAKERARKKNQKKIFVIGGASIIAQSLEKGILDEIILTVIYDHFHPVENPVFLNFEMDKWKIIEDSGVLISENSEPESLGYRYYRLSK